MNKRVQFRSCFLVSILVLLTLFTLASQLKAADPVPIPFKLKNVIPPAKTMWIGVLQGTWKQMGTQYGQRCGGDIAANFDIMWKNAVIGGNELWQQGRTAEQRAEYAVKYLQRFLQELSYLSSEIIEFWEGFTVGAAEDLQKCTYANACSDLLKIALINFSNLAFHPNWDFENDRPLITTKKHDKASKMYAKREEHDCNLLWVSGKATSTGHTYATRTVQGPIIGTPYSNQQLQVAYVAIPDDPKARVFWAQGRAGQIGGLGGGLLNDCGVGVLTSGCSYSDAHFEHADETCAPGIKDFVLASYGVMFSKTAYEAATKITFGTPRYRELSGRKTILGARGANIVFVDANEVYCVEHIARRFAIRKPGDLGELGNNYLVAANHFKYDKGSFDENGHFSTEKPMTVYEPEEPGTSTYYRFWSGMWMMKNNYGVIDAKTMLREIAPSHVGYDEAGNAYPVYPDTGAPTVPGTFCTHGGTRSVTNPLGTSGNANSSVFNLSTLEAWWVPVWPCHYKDWNLSWDYLDLNPFMRIPKGAAKSQKK